MGSSHSARMDDGRGSGYLSRMRVHTRFRPSTDMDDDRHSWVRHERVDRVFCLKTLDGPLMMKHVQIFQRTSLNSKQRRQLPDPDRPRAASVSEPSWNIRRLPHSPFQSRAGDRTRDGPRSSGAPRRVSTFGDDAAAGRQHGRADPGRSQPGPAGADHRDSRGNDDRRATPGRDVATGERTHGVVPRAVAAGARRRAARATRRWAISTTSRIS